MASKTNEQIIRSSSRDLAQLEFNSSLQTKTDTGGTVPASTSRIAFGSSGVLSSGTLTDVWNLSDTNPIRVDLDPLGEKLNIVSSTFQDRIGPYQGVGAVFVQGLDADGDYLSEVVLLNGLTPVQTEGNYSYFNFGSTVRGTDTNGMENLGEITISGADSGEPQGRIGTGEGVTRSTHYKVPNGHSMILKSINTNVQSTSGSSAKAVVFNSHVTVMASMTVTKVLFFGQQTDGGGLSNFSVPVVFKAGDIFKMQVTSLQNSTKVNIYSTIILMMGTDYAMQPPL